MPKTGEKCTFAGFYRYSGHIKVTKICHPSFDEEEIFLQVGTIFPPVSTCEKDAFWTYVRAP